jgi:predicted O-methyltransferase YrrM
VSGFADEPRQAEDLHAWQILRPLLDAGGYLPWSTGSMRPAALVTVCNEIVHNDRAAILECGSGVSTVVLARLLRQRGSGTLTAIEHDEGWAHRVDALLHAEGLDQIARVISAPLEGDPPWYATAPLTALPDAIDLLIVDGPPADQPATATRRAPALAFFAERLVPGATVVLDDLDRPGEQHVIASWERDTTWRFAVQPRTGLAVGTDADATRVSAAA